MNNSYLLGVAAAIVAGINFNLGLVIQKLAINRMDSKTGLMRQVLHSPAWLGGFALQFFIGVPLNMFAAVKIGPVLLPGLMAIGMIVLAIGAVRLAHERFSWVDGVGIFLIIAAEALLPFSKLAVDWNNTNFGDRDLQLHLGIFTAAVAICILICHLLQRRLPRQRSVLFAVNSGLFYVESNLWLGILMGLLERMIATQFSMALLGGVALASAITAVGSFMGIAMIQRAFQCGDATRLVPIQNAPPQILALAPYVVVFNLKPPTPYSFLIAGGAVLLILVGSVLLANRQATLSASTSDNPGEKPVEKA